MIAIIDGCGTNITSIQMALSRLGFNAELTVDRNTIRAASHVILPGVGNARSSMENLTRNSLAEFLPTLIQPVLGICVGMQILFNRSAEGEIDCLNLLSENIVGFDASLITPHMGWNQVFFQDEAHPIFTGIPNGSDFYFANSYYAPLLEDTLASTLYGVHFSSVIQKRNFIGVQFHPEKSGAMGAQLLRNFCNSSA